MYLGFLRTVIHVDYGGLGISGSSIEKPEGRIAAGKARQKRVKSEEARSGKICYWVRPKLELTGNWFN